MLKLINTVNKICIGYIFPNEFDILVSKFPCCFDLYVEQAAEKVPFVCIL
jgi:hypothetical protein